MSAPSSLTDEQVLAVLRHRVRLREIAALRLTEPDVRELLQEICERAAAELDLPIGLVTIVLDEAQYFVAQVGVDGWMNDAQGTPSEWSFCRYGVATQQPLVVEDTTEHPLVRDNPLVKVDGLRCYAGVPLVSSKGLALGSFCVAGVETRQFSEAELARLHQFADEAVARIERRRDRGATS